MSKKPKIIVCKNCNAEIGRKVKICPSCGSKNKKPIYKRVWFILLVIILGIGGISYIKSYIESRFDWSEVELSMRLPEPESKRGKIISNDSDSLSMRVEKTSKSDYKKYWEECGKMGYSLECQQDGDRYEAFDKEGYALSLSYFGDTMYIDLDAPTEMGSLTWPKSEIANLLPKAKSTVGKVSSDTADSCYIYVGETSIDDFNAYVDQCTEYGFSVDYEKGDKFYNAKDENGNKLSLSYQGNKVMVIQICKPDEEQTDADSETSSEQKQEELKEESSDTAKSVEGMRPEFKKAMDSYEDFMNEYCDFMKKYEKSKGTDLLSEYTDYMSKYAEFVEDFEAWDKEELNTKEAAYYVKVQTRVNEKLLNLE